ncbi:hypothetical protein [Glaciihabitans sp. UYNi722]|uniref:hypothetical protein n=1 Tax=Glaciihabitans sp. UYNi722 TaxID=3156344 RepID=UPI0033922841
MTQRNRDRNPQQVLSATDVTVARAKEISSISRVRIIRSLEDAALERLDPQVLRAVTDVDRRFDREHAELSGEYERRFDAMEPDPAGRPVSGAADVFGMLLAVIAVALVLAGDKFGSAVPLAPAAVTATVLIVVAACLHAAVALGRSRSGRGASHAWSMIVVTAAAALITAAWLVVRWQRQSDQEFAYILVLAAVIVVGGLICLLVAVGAGRNAARRAHALRAGALRRIDETADLESALEIARTRSQSEARSFLERMPGERRRELDEAILAGVREMLKKEEYGLEFVRPLRESPRFELRYTEKL